MSREELEAALQHLEDLARKGVPPSHYVARHVLLTLGEGLREQPEGCGAQTERARTAGRAAGEAWANAVQTELTLACGEFAQSVDPRYLRLPDYDLGYTRSARARLADRLSAARALGFELSLREREVLALADRVLATVQGENAVRSPDQPPGAGSGHGSGPSPRSPDKGDLK